MPRFSFARLFLLIVIVSVASPTMGLVTADTFACSNSFDAKTINYFKDDPNSPQATLFRGLGFRRPRASMRIYGIDLQIRLLGPKGFTYKNIKIPGGAKSIVGFMNATAPRNALKVRTLVLVETSVGLRHIVLDTNYNVRNSSPGSLIGSNFMMTSAGGSRFLVYHSEDTVYAQPIHPFTYNQMMGRLAGAERPIIEADRPIENIVKTVDQSAFAWQTAAVPVPALSTGQAFMVVKAFADGEVVGQYSLSSLAEIPVPTMYPPIGGRRRNP